TPAVGGLPAPHTPPAPRRARRAGRSASAFGSLRPPPVPAAPPSRPPHGQGHAPGPEPHRRLRPRPAGGEGTLTQPAGRPPAPLARGDLRPHRPAPHDGGAGTLPGRQPPRRLRAGGGAVAGLPRLRRALGTALARPGPLRRDRRLQGRRPPPRRPPLPR